MPCYKICFESLEQDPLQPLFENNKHQFRAPVFDVATGKWVWSGSGKVIKDNAIQHVGNGLVQITNSEGLTWVRPSGPTPAPAPADVSNSVQQATLAAMINSLLQARRP